MSERSGRIGMGLAVVVVLGVVSVAWGQNGQAAQNESLGYQALGLPAGDPPSRVARVSVLVGNVSVEPASVNQFNAAETNYPMTTGDRIYADVGANAELETGQLAVRLGQQTDLTVTAMTDALAQFGLAQGSVHLRSFSLEPGTTTELDTPNVAVTVLQPGDVRVDVDAASDTTVVTLESGQVQVNGNGLEQVMGAGERLRLSGSNPVYAQGMGRERGDGLDRFSESRDGQYEGAVASEAEYVNPDTIGVEDLNGYGSWASDPDYGSVWYPAGVAVGWQPYSCGHWTWIAPWGWTWVECEPWGFAPFHYGRWARFGPRWGWVPGPPVMRPIYSPALVAFVGGDGFAVGGVGVTAWFPLGPREPYVPWYHASTLYANRVNVTNIYNRNTVEVRNIYNQRATNVYVDANAGSRVYVNRQTATVAVPHETFSGGRPVAQAQLRGQERALETAPVLPHPMVSPERGLVAQTPARAVPAMQARPTLASHEDTGVRVNGAVSAGASGGARGVVTAGPQEQIPPTTLQRTVPTNGMRSQTMTPMPAPQTQAPQTQPAQVPPTQAQRVTPAPVQPSENQPARALFNKAVPPEPRPSFEQQRQAIQATDPGRPLSPQQMNNIRQSAPAGPPQQREMPHPAPAPSVRPAPPPQPKK